MDASTDTEALQTLTEVERRTVEVLANDVDGLLETHAASVLSTCLSLPETECLRILTHLATSGLIRRRGEGAEARYEVAVDTAALAENHFAIDPPHGPLAQSLAGPNSPQAMSSLAKLFLETQGTLYVAFEISPPEVFPQLEKRASLGRKTVFLLPRRKDVPLSKQMNHDEALLSWRRFLNNLPREKRRRIELRVTRKPCPAIYTSALSKDIARCTFYSYESWTTRDGQMFSIPHGSSLYQLVKDQYAVMLVNSLPLFNRLRLVVTVVRSYLAIAVLISMLVLIAIIGATSGLGEVVLACAAALAAELTRESLAWFLQRDRQLFGS